MAGEVVAGPSGDIHTTEKIITTKGVNIL